MKLISCASCAVVLDADRIDFPDTHDDGEFKPEVSRWDGNDFVAVVDCPNCGDKIDDTGASYV